MLYYLSLLESSLSELRLFQYITFRTLGAAATAFVLSLLLAPGLIKKLRVINFGTSVGGQMLVRPRQIPRSELNSQERANDECHRDRSAGLQFFGGPGRFAAPRAAAGPRRTALFAGSGGLGDGDQPPQQNVCRHSSRCRKLAPQLVWHQR